MVLDRFILHFFKKCISSNAAMTENSEVGFAQARFYSNVPTTRSFASDNGYANAYGGYAQPEVPAQQVVQDPQKYYGNGQQTNATPAVYENVQ